MTAAGRAVAVVCTAAAGALVAVLHVLRPDLSPVSDRLSEYATGGYAGLMTATFVLAGVGVIAFGVGMVATGRDAGALLVAAVSIAAGIGIAAAAAVPTGQSPQTEQWHTIVSGVGAVGATCVAVVWSLRTRRPVDLTLAAAAAVLAVISPVLHDTTVTGLGQRALWAALGLWFLRAAWRLPAAGATRGNAPAAAAVEGTSAATADKG